MGEVVVDSTFDDVNKKVVMCFGLILLMVLMVH